MKFAKLLGQEDYTPLSSEGWSFWFPEKASSIASDVDWTYDVILWVSVVFFILIVAPMVLFMVQYRRRSGYKKKPSSDHNLLLELSWTVLPTLILVAFFVKGVWGYLDMRTPPDVAEENVIIAEAYQFGWSFTYPNGTVTTQLHLPVNTPVKFRLQSKDVLHSFFIPAFRIKHDVVPGRYGFTWVNPTSPGAYRLNCAEYCGDGHSLMRRDVIVHDKTWDEVMKEIEWKYDDPEHSRWENGQHIYQIRCSGCHSVDGTAKTGPTFQGSWGESRDTDQGPIVMDDNYVRDSIKYPNQVIVNGYPKPSPMPSFDKLLSDEEINYLIEFIKSPEIDPNAKDKPEDGA
ncbi:MAG: cytochrome c oxidase subunit II [Planctomycetota bacterium]|nr:cytochrome c oxidase subunit II [Planctomycetota bacterium]